MAEAPISDQLIFIDISQDPGIYLNDGDFLNQSTENGKSEENKQVQLTKTTIAEATADEEYNADSLLKINPRKIRCPECNRYSAENEEKMQRHIRRKHRGENPYQCYMCDYSTYNSTLFEEHVRIHQGIKPFKCSFCEYRSVSKKNTKKHELIHRPDNPLKCPECDFIAHHKRSLTTHKQKHIDDKSVIKLKIDKLSCDSCSFVAHNKLVLSKHKHQTHHEKRNMNPKKGKKDLLFVCSICLWSSSHRPRILLHLIHHPNQIVDQQSIDIDILKKYGIMS